MVGGVFGLTVNTKFVDVVSAPSLTVTVMVDVPLPPASRCDDHVSVRAVSTTKDDIGVWNQRCV